MTERKQSVAVVGAGPAGLTAAWEMLKREPTFWVEIFEADDQVGGISRTVERDGWRFDIGGHRFFTKVERVEETWHEILSDDQFLLRPRMSRIYYNGKFFDYPLKAFNALFNLGPIEAVRCFLSYLWVRIKPPKDQSNFEGWVAARFGWRLYRTFFKTYTEKVWGVPATEIQADWAAQRIKNLSLGKAVISALMPQGKKTSDVTSLIEEFQYPKYGPGMMWEECTRKVVEQGAQLTMRARVTAIEKEGSDKLLVEIDGRKHSQQFDYVISSMPVNQLIECLSPTPPKPVRDAAAKLKHRDFLTVALVVPEKYSFPDNWIYIHSPQARVGRVQNYGSWSPFMVKDGMTCLGLEYFVNEDEDLWQLPDEELVGLATRELSSLGLTEADEVIEGFVVRMKKAYPVYDGAYGESLEIIREYLTDEWPQIMPVGRNGMHRYNNQDHSMMTAMVSVDRIIDGSEEDVWSVNVEDEYHEEGKATPSDRGSGRSAPVT